jgi:hypothetical protein
MRRGSAWAARYRSGTDLKFDDRRTNPVATAPGSDSVSESRFVYGQAAVATRAVESRQKQL